MNAIDKRIRDLQNYQPDKTAEADLDEFWLRTLQEVNDEHFNSNRTERSSLLQNAIVYDVIFDGYNNTPIHGSFMKPVTTKQQVPCLIIFPGYTNAKMEPEHYAHWISMGIAVFAVDVRGQAGQTGNTLGSSHGFVKGWITEGILDLEQCYYKAISVDNLRAVRWVFEQSDIDTTRVGVYGASQGGGLALLASVFYPQLCATVADIPNLCHLDYGVLYSNGSLSEIAEFCRRFSSRTADVLKNISYFDHLNLAERITLPIMLSVGLKDTICMPETIFPVYKQLASENKSLEIYPFTGHAVEAEQRQKGYEFLAKWLKN